MKHIRRPIAQIFFILKLMGIDLRRVPGFIRAVPWYLRDLREFKHQQQLSPVDFPLARHYPCLEDKNSAGRTARGAYFYQDLLIAQRIFANEPTIHVDVGSRVDGFVAHVASFRPIELLDIRPVEVSLPNINFRQGDLMAELDATLVECCDSLSCLHALEHFGLGRYNDPLSVNGHLRGFDNLYRMLQRGGKFYFSVPIGPQRINFNAHRVYSMQYLLDLIQPRYQIDYFSFVTDAGDLIQNAKLTPENIQHSFNCDFGCAIFELTKL